MKHKRLSSLRQNILNKKSTINNDKREKIILTNLYPYSLPVKFHDISNKNDELLMKKKIFNHSKNFKHLGLGLSYLNSFKSINKNNSNIKNNTINKTKDQTINKSRKNNKISQSIDNSKTYNRDLKYLNNKNYTQLNYLLNNNFFKNKNNKNGNLSINQIKTHRGDLTFFSSSENKIIKNKNTSDFNLEKTSKNKQHSITSINSRKNSAQKKNIMLKKNLHNNDLVYNENRVQKNESSNYRIYLFNEKNKNFDKKHFDENKNEIAQIIDNKIKNKGLFYLYNYQNNISNNKKKQKNSIKYPSFNSPKHIAINNSNLYNISKGEISFKKPMMVLAPSSNEYKNQINKDKSKESKYNSFMAKNDNNLYKILPDKLNNKKEEDNYINTKKSYSSQKNQNDKTLQLFYQNDSNKNCNNNINMNYIKNINNLTNNLQNIKKKLKIKKDNKTDLLFNNQKEINTFNKMIEKFTNLKINNKEKSKKLFENKFEYINNEQNKEDNIKINKNENKLKKQISLDSSKTKKESKKSLNIINFDKKIKILEKNENLFENISDISKTSTAIKDSNYYMEKSKKLIDYIKEYFNKHNRYPETKINFYLYGRKIGQGAFGKVNLGLNVLTGRVVAIKSFKKSSETKFTSNINKILYETNLMKRFNHPNITKILEVFHDEEYMLIIMEYINGGNLFSFVKKRRKLSEKTAKFLFRQIILGIKHIHSQNVVHRDIKLENIIIDFNNTVKICDFGIGKVLDSSNELLFDKCGTPMYMAPEIILCNKKNGYRGFPVDIWSSGITLYIMLSGTLPFNIKNKSLDNFSKEMKNKNYSSDLKYEIVNSYPKQIKNISNEAKDLLNGLLNKNPEKRLTCEQILNHPWLKNNNNENTYNKYHLFTKSEMTMMSKTYIDYRKGTLEDLRENFTLTNLKSDEIKLCEKNITTKSTILAPFNSAIKRSSLNGIKNDDKYDDFNNSKIKLENDLIIFNNKVKEFNLNYELNNNQEVDNGMLIKTKTDISLSASANNNSVISNNNKQNIENENHNINEYQYIEEKNNLINKDIKDNNYFNDKNNSFDINNPKIINILKEIENYGYQKEYIINCIKNNILCHVSTVYYLLKNYGDIK